jgi:CheY-like chemotaxis protein
MALVLVVDDEFGIVKLLEEVLKDEGHQVLVAANGRQALEQAAKATPALIITDLMMPVMDGAELIKAMAADQQLAKVPVILISSVPEAMIAERISSYTAFVQKPFNIFDLIDLVAELSGRAPSNSGERV